MGISIVIPVYNAEEYLERNLYRVVTQLSEQDELILIDDGSTDKSGEICDKIAIKAHNIYAIHQANGGVSSARNRGIQASHMRYITFIDSDDSITDYYMSYIRELVKQDNDLWIFGSTLENNKKVSLKTNYLSDGTYRNMQDIYSLFLSGCSNELWNKIYKRDIINAYKISFDESVSLGEDLIFSLDYLEHINSVKVSSRPIYRHKITDEGLGNRKATIKIMDNHVALLKRIDLFIETHNISNENIELAYSFCLQIFTNYVGKLYLNGYTKKEIFQYLEKQISYKKVIQYRYHSKMNIIRQFLMKRHLVNIIANTFKK